LKTLRPRRLNGCALGRKGDRRGIQTRRNISCECILGLSRCISNASPAGLTAMKMKARLSGKASNPASSTPHPVQASRSVTTTMSLVVLGRCMRNLKRLGIGMKAIEMMEEHVRLGLRQYMAPWKTRGRRRMAKTHDTHLYT